MLTETGAHEEKNSYGDNELADAEKIFGAKAEYSSIISEARPGLERETLSDPWTKQSKKPSGTRNCFAKKMWQPFFLIITHTKWMEYILYTARETGKDLIGVLLGPPKTYCDILKKSYCVILDPIGMFSNDGTL